MSAALASIFNAVSNRNDLDSTAASDMGDRFDHLTFLIWLGFITHN